MDANERWIKSGLLGDGIFSGYDITRVTDTSHGPVIAHVNVSHVTEEARRTASYRADLICSIPELKQRAEAAEARAAQLQGERDELARKLEQAQAENDRLHAELVKVNQQLAQVVIGSVR
jgi:septal ring factor EnvC (AmiA/AmiB activator)